MKRIVQTLFALLVCGFLAAAVILGRQASADNASQPTPRATQVRATATKSPTPTVDWQKTAVVAQATADEARRVNAQATADHERYLAAQLQGTISANELEALRIRSTATAALTAVPLTSTAQANAYKFAATQHVLLSAQLTATSEAPVKLREMKNAQAYDAKLDFYVGMWVKGMLGFFLLAVPILIFIVRPSPRAPQAAEELSILHTLPVIQPQPRETVLRVQETGAFPKMDRMVVPCSPKQWDGFVRGVILENISLAFNNWEGAESPFTRDEYILVRNFLQSNRLAQSNGQGALILTAQGEELFRAWLEAGDLPQEYHFQ